MFLFKTLSPSLWMPQCYNYSQTNLVCTLLNLAWYTALITNWWWLTVWFILQWFRDEMCKEEAYSSVDTLLNLVDPLHDAHCLVLRDVELRVAAWETKNSQQQRIADIILRACDYLPVNYFEWFCICREDNFFWRNHVYFITLFK